MRRHGIDVGNYSLKEYPHTNVKSLVSTDENILGSKLWLEYGGLKYFIGEGLFDTELNKSSKENFLPLLLTSILLNSTAEEVLHQVVCGLPINQYKANKDALEELVLGTRVRDVVFKDERRKIIITDFTVYPEAVGAYYSLDTEEDIIIVDIGGRTTDIAYIVDKKLKLASTTAVGTLSIYKGVADRLNAEYGLDYNIEMVDRVIDRGYLNIDGERADLSFITEILRNNFLKIKEDLDMKFPARTEKIVLVGGGAKLFEKAFRKRYKNCEIADNPVFANAIGFQRVGDMQWG